MNKNNLLDISIQEINTEDYGANPIDENSPNAIMLSNSNGEISSISYRIMFNDDGTRHSVVPEKKTKKNHKDYRSSDLRTLGTKCELYREFESGSRRLNHEELFALATNIIGFETGINKFHEIVFCKRKFPTIAKYFPPLIAIANATPREKPENNSPYAIFNSSSSNRCCGVL